MIDKKNLPANLTSGRINPIDSGKDWKLNFEVWGKSKETNKRVLVTTHLFLYDADTLFDREAYKELDSDAKINPLTLELADLARVRLMYIAFIVIKEVVSIIKYGDKNIKTDMDINAVVNEDGIEYFN